MKELMTKTSLQVAVLTALAFAVAGCDGADPNATNANQLAPLICDAGMIAWDFGEMPITVTSSEGVQQNPVAKIANGAPPPTIRVLEAQCGSGEYFTSNLGENCDGRSRCLYKAKCYTKAEGAVFSDQTVKVKYECSGDSRTWSLSSPFSVSGYINMELTCTSATPPVARFRSDQQCVPEQCHGATRRNEKLECVPDFTRPYVTISGDYTNQAMVLSVPYGGFFNRNVARRVTETGFDTKAPRPADWPTDRTWYGAVYDQYNADYWVLYPKGIYSLAGTKTFNGVSEARNTTLKYVPSSQSPDGLKGRVVMWMADVYTKNSQSVSAFRCVMHSVEMSKYGKGTPVGGGDPRNVVTLDQEKFQLPTDCTNQSNAAAFRELEATKLGLTLAQFDSQYKLDHTELRAAFDLENVNVDIPTGKTRETVCAPNPVDFFYNRTAKLHDLQAYYSQNSIEMRVGSASQYSTGGVNANLHTPLRFGDISRTEIGLSDVNVRQAELRLKTTGTLRQGVRIDIGWYIAHDENGYWQKFGFDNWNIQLVSRTYLVPKDSNGNQVAAGTAGYTVIGETPLTATDPMGTTVSARYLVTEALRTAMLTANSDIEIGPTGRRTFELLTCVEILNKQSRTKRSYGLDNSSEGTEGYYVDYGAGGSFTPMGFSAAGRGCQWSKTPLLVRLDKATQPLEPLSAGDWSGEANPAAAGDGSMSQKLDNDSERNCTDNDAGTPDCDTTTNNDLNGTGLLGGTYATIDSNSQVDTGKPYSADGEADLMEFNVLEEDDESPWQEPGKKVTLTFVPPWEDIREHLSATWTAPEWKTGRYAGMMGLGVGWGFKFPVFFGPVQLGVAVITVSLGFSIELNLEYSADEKYPCLNQNGPCAQEMTSAKLSLAMTNCYATGGRLAEYSSAAEAQRVKAALDGASANDIWLGAQVANEYATPGCATTWVANSCASNHKQYLRWLTNDEDFATSTGFAAATWQPAYVFFPSSASPAKPGMPSGKPVDRGVVLNKSGTIGVVPIDESHASVCVYENAVSDNSHTFKAEIGIGLAVGVTLAFCTPSDEAGICLEGSINFVSVALKPSLTYSYHRLTDAQHRRAVRSNVNFSFDWELKVLEGSIDVKLVFGPFELKYNLLTFDGLKIPASAAGGKFYESNLPSIEPFK